MDNYGVIIFHTSSSAMQAEAALIKCGLVAKLIPTPRELSSDCGISLRFDWSMNDEVTSLLTKAHVEIVGIYPLPKK